MRLAKRVRKQSDSLELSMTAMIDVVFLLLIFFLVTSSFQRTEKQVDANIKTRQQSGGQQGETMPTVVHVSSVNGRHVYRLGGLTTGNIEELGRTLDALPAKDDGAFVVVSDAVPFEMAAAAVARCKEADFFPVTYVPGDDASE